MESDAVKLPLKEIKAIVQAGSGDAALLYLANSLEQYSRDQEAVYPAGFSPARRAGALAALEKLGIRTNAPISAQPEEDTISGGAAASDVAAELRKKGEFSQLVAEAERRLETKLSTPSLAILMNIYSNLELPTDVLFLLLTYCVEETKRFYGPNRRPTVRQLEKEAFRWARLELDTSEKAEEYIMRRSRALEKSGEIAQVLGIGGRKLARSEENYITRWIQWGFGSEEIENAYDRTVLKTGGLNWKYLNSILKNWHEKNLHTLDEINEGDSLRVQESPSEKYEQEAIEWAKRYRRKLETGGAEEG